MVFAPFPIKSSAQDRRNPACPAASAPTQQTVNDVTYYTPAFVADSPAVGYQLLALKLTKAGDHFYDFLTGEAYNPVASAQPSPLEGEGRVRGVLTLTGLDGTQYRLTSQGRIGEEIRPDGKQFILSDSGITAVGTGETIQFICMMWNWLGSELAGVIA